MGLSMEDKQAVVTEVAAQVAIVAEIGDRDCRIAQSLENADQFRGFNAIDQDDAGAGRIGGCNALGTLLGVLGVRSAEQQKCIVLARLGARNDHRLTIANAAMLQVAKRSIPTCRRSLVMRTTADNAVAK